jgi:hypothetical protein
MGQSNVYGLCGAFGVYRENFSSPCECLKGFETNSTNYTSLNDWSSGCVRKSPLECEKNTYANGKKDWLMECHSWDCPLIQKHIWHWVLGIVKWAWITVLAQLIYAYNSSGYCVRDTYMGISSFELIATLRWWRDYVS